MMQTPGGSSDLAADNVTRPGAAVVMHLALRLLDGTEVENTFGKEPLSFVMGDGSLAPEIERLLYGMTEGQSVRREVSPEQGFGYPDTDNLHNLPRSEFPNDMDLAPGMVVGFALPTGEEIPGRIDEVGEADVRVDFNHPLCGHRFLLDAEVLSVGPPAGLAE